MLPGWDAIPGARGCTPQSCAFRDHAAELDALGARVAGLSAQTLDDQIEFAERNHMPFPVIADPELRLRDALRLPTFEVAGLVLYKRLTLVAERGRIAKVFYPVFPPDRNAADVLDWLKEAV
jgi:peroxiredoxin